MPYVIVRHKVTNVAEWKPFFDEGVEMRKAAGSETQFVFHNVDDPNDVVILLEIDDVEQARQFGQSSELKDAMKEHGVIGPVERVYLEKME